MPLMKWARPGSPITSTPPPELAPGRGVLIRLLALNTGRGHCRARILRFTAPRGERPGRGAERGYSFVSMSHHTARGKARPVMG